MPWSELRPHEEARHSDILAALQHPGTELPAERTCPICGAVLAWGAYKRHVQVLHPRIAWYGRFVVEVTTAVVAGYFVAYFALTILWLSNAISLAAYVYSGVVFVVLLGLTAYWIRVAALRHLVQLRAVWQASGSGSVTPANQAPLQK